MFTEKMKKEEFPKVWEIMEESFPLDERRPFEEQKALLANPVYSIYVLVDCNQAQGFVALWKFENLAFVEHFAVAKEHRCKGFGAKLLSDVVSDLNTDVCLEVEPPCSDITKRRVEFYRRNGFVLNEFPYIQPPLSAGQQSVPLMIMTYKKAASKEEFELIRDTLYARVYGV